MRSCQILALFIMLLANTTTLAMPDAPPPHSLSPTLNGLDIATFIKKDRVKIALYVINHETFPVMCDTQYHSGPENQDAAEVTIPGGKADSFRFTYGRRGETVLLELICIDPQKKPATDDSP